MKSRLVLFIIAPFFLFQISLGQKVHPKSGHKTIHHSNRSAHKKNRNATSNVRVGCICNDGTRSYATGRGACSHHGGVNHWLYN